MGRVELRQLIDRICEKFNVFYLDIVGKDKWFTPLEAYQWSFKIKTTKERGARLLAELFDLQNKQGITTNDDTNNGILMSDDGSERINIGYELDFCFDIILWLDRHRQKYNDDVEVRKT